MPQDYILKEIGKIGAMLQEIAVKLGILDGMTPSDNLPEQLSSELVTGLGLDPEELLSKESPIEYLVSEIGFSPENLETLAVLVARTYSSEKADAFVSDVRGYLDHLGLFSFALHSLE